MNKHESCETRCQMNEHKGYPCCEELSDVCYLMGGAEYDEDVEPVEPTEPHHCPRCDYECSCQYADEDCEHCGEPDEPDAQQGSDEIDRDNARDINRRIE